MEQLWYTWSPFGIAKITGYQARAASAGLADIRSKRYQDVDPHLRYSLPIGSDAYEAKPETSPVTLAYLKTGDEYVIVQKVYTGTDKYGRPGAFFCHLLAGLPPTFTAGDAIELWKSPFWQNSDASIAEKELMLPYVEPQQLIEGHLSYDDMRDVGEVLPFVIQAFLSLPSGQKLYIFGPDQQVAALIWGLSHCLPRSVQRDLTFSTYEQKVDKVEIDRAEIRVIGSCQAIASSDQDANASKQQDLPADCYTHRGFALNCYTGKRTQLLQDTPEAAYARFATQCLLNAEARITLFELLNSTQRINFANAGSFLVFFKFFIADERQPLLTLNEITDLVENYDLAALLLKREGVQRAVIDLAVSNSQWWTKYGSAAFENLTRLNNAALGESAALAISSLAKKVAVEAAQAAMVEDKPLFLRLADFLAILAPSSTNPMLWVELLHMLKLPVHPSALFNYEQRFWLLQKWADGSKYIPETDIQHWLEIYWNELEALLNSQLPTHWQNSAVQALLTNSELEIPPTISGLVTKYLSRFKEALKQLGQSPQTRPDAIRFFKQLMKYKYQGEGKLAFLGVLLDSNAQDETELGTLLNAAKLSSTEALVIFQGYAKTLVHSGLRTQNVQDMSKLFMERLAGDKNKLLDANVGLVLEVLYRYKNQFPDALAEWVKQVSNWYHASEGLPYEGQASLQFEKRYLMQIGNAIIHLNLQDQQRGQKGYMYYFYFRLASSIKSEKDLRCVIESLAPIFIQSASQLELLGRLAQFVGGKYGHEHPQELERLAPIFVKLALEYALHLKDSNRTEFLDPVLRSLIIDKGLLNYLHQIANQSWPDNIFREWKQYVNVLSERSANGGIGSAIGFVKKLVQTKSPQGESGKQITEGLGTLPFEVQPNMPSQQRTDAPTASAMHFQTSVPQQQPQMAAVSHYRFISAEDVAYVNGIHITRNWFEIVFRTKDKYYLAKRASLEKKGSKRGSDKKAIQAEIARLNRYLFKEPQQQSQKVCCELIDDVLIKEWLKAHPNVKTKMEKEAEAGYKAIYNELKSYLKENQLPFLKMHSDAEIQQVLRIYQRRSFVYTYLLNEAKIDFKSFLKELRSKAPAIEMRDSLPFIR